MRVFVIKGTESRLCMVSWSPFRDVFFHFNNTLLLAAVSLLQLFFDRV